MDAEIWFRLYISTVIISLPVNSNCKFAYWYPSLYASTTPLPTGKSTEAKPKASETKSNATEDIPLLLVFIA